MTVKKQRKSAFTSIIKQNNESYKNSRKESLSLIWLNEARNRGFFIMLTLCQVFSQRFFDY